MKPNKFIPKEKYRKIAKKLIKSPNVEDFLTALEIEYLESNPNLFQWLSWEIRDISEPVFNEWAKAHVAGSTISNDEKQKLNNRWEHWNELLNLVDRKRKAGNKESTLKKIEWLGSQKELGELFIILKKKGWIHNFEYSTIKACFTKSNSIHQILKPDQDKKEPYDLNYPQVYTSNYSPQFFGIKENPKSNPK